MPAYNAEKTIGRSLGSVAFQTYPNWKIIIRDDLSTDSTQEQVEIFKKSLGVGDSKISYKKNPHKF